MIALAPHKASLLDAYTEYVSTVSTPGMAVSHQTAALLAHYCETRKPARACDLGSGFSSYVLRTAPDCLWTTSVDTDPVWLHKTGGFLTERNAGRAGQLMTYRDWLRDVDRYDLIFHDLAQGEFREQAMWAAVARLAPGGLILFDDAHHHGHRTAMLNVIEHYDLTPIDVHDVTLDSIGRYALAATKEP